MCFSEEASFTAAVAIAVVAGASLQRAGIQRLPFSACAAIFCSAAVFGRLNLAAFKTNFGRRAFCMAVL